MSLVTDSIAAQLATLTPVVDVPTGALGYGTDLVCTTDVTEDLAEVDPFTVDAISQALFRRLITPRGALPDDADYGFDLRGYLNRGVTIQDLRTLTGQITAECRKDDRVEDVLVQATFTLNNAELRVSIRVTPVDPLETFSFTFVITDTAAVLEVIS